MADVSTVILVLVSIVLIFLIFDRWRSGGLIYARAKDGKEYIVEGGFSRPEAAEAANALAIINQRIGALATYLKIHHPKDRITTNILAGFNPDKIAEITPANAFGYTSYTVDRGRSMRFCLRDKSTFDLHEIDELTFVAFHELAHVAEWEADHETPFWEVFKYLLEQAVQGGIYMPTDYAIEPMRYCGMTVHYNPYFDPTLNSYVPKPY